MHTHTHTRTHVSTNRVIFGMKLQQIDRTFDALSVEVLHPCFFMLHLDSKLQQS